MKLLDYIGRIGKLKKEYNLSAEDSFILHMVAIFEINNMSYNKIEKYIIQKNERKITI